MTAFRSFSHLARIRILDISKNYEQENKLKMQREENCES